MKPEANSASSEWTIVAMLSIHPGRKMVKNSGNQSIRSGKSDGKHPPENSQKIELFPVGPSVKLGFRPFVKEPADHSDDVLNIFPTRAERIRAKKSLEGIGISWQLLVEEEVEDITKGRTEIAKGDAGTNPMDQSRHFSPSQKVHQTAGPGSMGEFQRKSGQDKADEGDHHREVKHDVEEAESTIDMTCFVRFHMLREEDPFGPQFPLLPEVLSPPEEGMEPEDPEDRNEKAGHQDEGSIKHGLSFWIIMGGMGNPLDEVGIGPGVAFSTGLYQTFIGDERFGIIRRQDAVKTMTVRTTRHQCRIAQMLNLSVVTFIIGLSGNQKDLVPSPSSPCRHDTSGRPRYGTPSEIATTLGSSPFKMGILWRPWQSLQVAESGFPSRTDLPWTLSE